MLYTNEIFKEKIKDSKALVDIYNILDKNNIIIMHCDNTSTPFGTLSKSNKYQGDIEFLLNNRNTITLSIYDNNIARITSSDNENKNKFIYLSETNILSLFHNNIILDTYIPYHLHKNGVKLELNEYILLEKELCKLKYSAYYIDKIYIKINTLNVVLKEYRNELSNKEDSFIILKFKKIGEKLCLVD